MKFKVLYIIFIVVSVLYPLKTVVGPITYRHILSLILLGVCMYEGFRSDKYLNYYLLFILFFLLSSVLTGFGLEFLNKLIGTYTPMIVAYSATYLLVKKYNGEKLLVWLFVGIGVFNAIVTIGQFFHLSLVDYLYEILKIDSDEEFLDLSERRMTLEGFAIPGLFNTVANGYFLSASAILVLYNHYGYKIINIALWSIVMVASLLAQERTGFFLAIIFSYYVFIRHFYSKSRTKGLVASSVIFIIVASLAVTYIDILFSSDMRYLRGFDLQNRDEYRNAAWSYLFNNPFGGTFEFSAAGNGLPHNFFLNALLCGGIFGGIILIWLLIIQIKKIWPYIFPTSKFSNAEGAFVWGLLYIDYTLNSMLHNISIASGAFLFFVWWAAFLALASIDTVPLKRYRRKMVL